MFIVRAPVHTGSDKGGSMDLCCTTTLQKDGYNVKYDKLKCKLKWSLDRKTVTIALDNNPKYYINLINLYINDSSKTISKLFEKLEVSIDDQVFDEMYSWDQMLTASGINGKRTITDHECDGRSYCSIPLPVAPFHKDNLIVSSGNIVITLKFTKDPLRPYLLIDLYGNHYNVQYNSKTMERNPYNFVTFQSQYQMMGKMNIGINEYKLNWKYPATHIYFWGFDKSRVTNVRLVLNKENHYNGPLGPLEHFKVQRGLGNINACIIFLSEADYVDQSGIENIVLIIETQGEGNIEIAGVTKLGVQYEDGKYKHKQ